MQKREGWKKLGIIPACAGSTSSLFVSCALVRDHPRMCGEHVVNDCVVEVFGGSSPHVRGAQIG